MDVYKLWFSGGSRYKNGVGILVEEELREQVVEVRRVNDMMIAIKLVVRWFTLNIISAYAPHTGLDVEEKVHFLEDLDEVVRGITHIEKLLIGGDFNGRIGSTLGGGYDDVHGGFGFEDKYEGGISLLDFASAFGLVVANSTFPKNEEHLVTFCSAMARTEIDYLLLRKDDKRVVKTARSSLMRVFCPSINYWRWIWRLRGRKEEGCGPTKDQIG
ncbi:uncharacterized protein LOC132607688 [Lycium barbarum]|uniref:uncharacterized protein LOC132607688 n=1 Tax=Lycium barbarum TaxID=112863 RepID=UPI00293F2E44|nr:uncharacterized protein LOC132607688 [Lycium barbarum]